MTQPSSETDPFEEARVQERIIAERLWAIRPKNRAWDTITYTHMETGGTGGSIAKIHHEDNLERARAGNDVLFAAKRLREVMYQPGKGAWLSMTLTITPAGNGWESTYNYNEKPVWELGEPSANAYAQELYVFPRDEEHIPDWFKEELKDATWTPPAD
jgi:hypothetical protein